MGAVLGLEESRERLARDASEDARLRLEHGHVLVLLAEHRRGLEADVAAADDDDLVRRLELARHAIDVGAIAHGVDADEIVAAAPEPPRRTSRGPDERAVSDRAPVRQTDLVGCGVHGDDALTEPHLDLLLLPVRRRTEQERVERLVAREVLLRERRTFVGKEGLVADHEDGSP